ncbi:hypothetical protein EBQ24_11275 [Allofranklinella schreckenbergeri]|uniref:Uncharacterized protein n=1 Tax=Allofranklinella schreckenbergeri TaxID=1076744 RepID=A0A3M6QTM9_9BURK|nr:hypothetical protein [Allofranklinella schreckenbergeri]RMX06211.1 hypothetical protein EBQ24_11275 [Allofranklinella schreckenbergeri]RRD40861.1 hypothetical protein EII18_10780 [Comamonadaceae bacterium OH3737_COT-264]
MHQTTDEHRPLWPWTLAVLLGIVLINGGLYALRCPASPPVDWAHWRNAAAFQLLFLYAPWLLRMVFSAMEETGLRVALGAAIAGAFLVISNQAGVALLFADAVNQQNTNASTGWACWRDIPPPPAPNNPRCDRQTPANTI